MLHFLTVAELHGHPDQLYSCFILNNKIIDYKIMSWSNSQPNFRVGYNSGRPTTSVMVRRM